MSDRAFGGHFVGRPYNVPTCYMACKLLIGLDLLDGRDGAATQNVGKVYENSPQCRKGGWCRLPVTDCLNTSYSLAAFTARSWSAGCLVWVQ